MANNIGDKEHGQWEGQDDSGKESHPYPRSQACPQYNFWHPPVPPQTSPFYPQTQQDGDNHGYYQYPCFTHPCPQYSSNYNYNLSSQSNSLPQMPPHPSQFYHQYHSSLRGPPHPSWHNVPQVQVTQLSPERNNTGHQISTPSTAGRSNRRRTSETESVFTRATSQSCHPFQSNLGHPAAPIQQHLPSSSDHQMPPQLSQIHSNLGPPIPIRRQLPLSFDPRPQPQFQHGDFPTLEHARATPSQQFQPSLPSQCNLSVAQTSSQKSQLSPSSQRNYTRGVHTTLTTQCSILSDEELKNLLNHPTYSSIQTYGDKHEYKLKEVCCVELGLEVGYKYSLNPHELAACYGPDGVITNHIFSSKKKNDRSENKLEKAKRPMRVVDVIYEPSRFVACKAHECKVMGLVVRFNHLPSKTRGILYYEKINRLTNKSLCHTNHHLFPFEIKKQQQKDGSISLDSMKTTKYSLSYQQKEALFKEFKNRNPTKDDIKLFVEKWKYWSDTKLRTSDEQDNDVAKLIMKSFEFVHNSKNVSKTKADAHWYFSLKKDSSQVSQAQLKQFLDILSTEKGSAERTRKYNASDVDAFPYLAKTEFRICCERIRITEHDCDGNTWTFIKGEYLHAAKLGEKAEQMFPDGMCQGEIDFFLSVCLGNEWQVGHEGISDRNHKYFLLCFIIAKSENHEAAGKLIDRGCELVKMDRILVDGGKALDKAIGIKDSANVNELKNALPAEGKSIVEELSKSIKCNKLDTSSNSDNFVQSWNPGLGQPQDTLFEEVVEAFIGQEDNEAGDLAGRANLESRVKLLLKKKRLMKERCHSHITRGAGSRGGGWRGGKGSLCRALLNNGCSKKKMDEILGIVFKMSKISWNDIESYKVACRHLLIEYDEHIKEYVRKAYLNGDPSDLGSHCSHRAGEVMSTNGMESRGKQIKCSHTPILKCFDKPKEESKNPMHMVAAIARDANNHMPLDDPLVNFAVDSPREKFIKSALIELRKVSDYKQPKTVTAASRKVQQYRNLTPTFLYSIMTCNGVEFAHEEVLGNKSVDSFIWHFPTIGRTFTSLSCYIKSCVNKYAQSPAGLNSRFKLEDATNIHELVTIISELRPEETRELYQMLKKRRQLNTPALLNGENVVMYLYRRAQRKIHPDWAVRKPSPKKTKKGKGAITKTTIVKTLNELTQEALAADKDAGEVEVLSTRSSEPPKKNVFQGETIAIDGDGGILEAAVSSITSHNDQSNTFDGYDNECERLCDRIRPRRELGDWVETKFNLNHPDTGMMRITCNCEDYSVWGDCEHCIYVEVIHRGHVDVCKLALANEQWQKRREQIIHNLKTQCGSVQSHET